MHPRDSGLYAIRFSSILLIIFLSAQQCLTSAHTPRSPKCVPGVFVLAARGSDETYHMPNVVNPAYADIGGLRNIANQIITAVGKGSYLEAVPYPATLNEYNVSLSHGIDAAQCMIRRYVDRCSGQIDPKMVLLGFSQGANVLSDALVGGVGSTGLLASKYGETIVAGALFADPSFVPFVHPLDAGNASTSGLFPKSDGAENTLSSVYGTRIRSYCQNGDAFCASGIGKRNITIHLEEVQTYGVDALDFLYPLVLGAEKPRRV